MVKNLLQILRNETSQHDMAEKYGVSQQTWSSWEQGRTCPDLSVMLKMEQDFGIPLEVIFFNRSNYKMLSNSMFHD